MFSTSSTFTSLYRLASMRRAWSRSASTTIVMRETSGLSVRPTVSESILKARRRNSEATRVNTPGLFSTCTTNVFSICFSRVRRGLDDGTGPADHFMQRGPGGHHRVDRILLLYLEVNQNGSLVLARHFYRRYYLSALRHRDGTNSKGIRKLHKVGAEDWRCFVVAIIEKFLPLANHPEIAVVDDGDVDFQLFLNHRRQLAHRHLEPAVAHHHPHIGLGARGLHSDRCGKGETHGAKAA